MLKTGDFFQLQIEVSGGRVEWYKDGVLVPTIAWDEFQEWEDTTPLVNVDQPGRTHCLHLIPIQSLDGPALPSPNQSHPTGAAASWGGDARYTQ